MYRTALSTAALVIASAAITPATAAPVVSGSKIDLAGYLMASGGTSLGSATYLDFIGGPTGSASPGNAGAVTSYGGGTGTLAGFGCSSGCGSILDITNLTVGANAIANFLMLTGGGNASPIAFDLASVTSINRSDSDFLTFKGTGTLRYDGFDATPATFLFSSQGLSPSSFSATVTASAVPEPAAWGMLILGFGLMGMTMRYRRRSTGVTFG